MIFNETKIPGVFEIELDRKGDDRGFFARMWCQREFEEHGLTAQVVQTNVSFSRHKGTLRGLHYQRPPHAEAKLIRCLRGAIFDVAVDLREDSPTYREWVGVELTPERRNMLFVPEGCAHGFQTLEDDSEVLYQVSAFYAPEAEAGARYDDPAFGVEWPLEVSVISDKDTRWAPFQGGARKAAQGG